MNGQEIRDKVFELKYAAGVNCNYHHAMEARFGWWDKAIKVAVAVMAAAGLYFAIADSPPFGLIVAGLSLVTAMVLNIAPVGDKEKRHGELYRLWTDLYGDVEQMELSLAKLKDSQSAGEDQSERLAELSRKRNGLNALDLFPDRALLQKCEEDENERMWGEGVRTPAQIAAEDKRRRGEQAISPSASAGDLAAAASAA